jgi:RNA polymerase sigma-70 factor, ECF subfamily
MIFPEENKLKSDLRKGSVNAFNAVFQSYHKRIYNFCLSLHQTADEAAETVQRVFIALWEQRNQIDENEALAAYLFSIAKYMVYRDFKLKVYKKAVFNQINTSVAKHGESTKDEVLYNELKSFLNSTIEKLPERQREIFKLSRFTGLTYKQIAIKLEISENTVDTQIRRALDYIRERYNAFYR